MKKSNTSKISDNQISRRKFISRTTLATGAIAIIPRHVLGRGFTAPSDRINLGFIGLGKQTVYLTKFFTQNTDAQIVAGCDVWKPKNDWFKKHVAVNYAEQRNQTGYNDVETTGDYKELLARKDVDAVVIATPDHWHSIQAVDAMKAGKHIYCEKPMTQHIQGGIDMVKTMKETGRIVQVGSMQRSWEKFRRACELVRNGYLGEISKVLVNVGDPAIPFNMASQEVPEDLDWNTWCGPAPLIPYNERLSPRDSNAIFPDWRLFKETGGGLLTDWGAHMFDIAQWALGMDHTGPVRYIPPTDRTAVRGMRMFYENGIEMVHEDFERGWGVRFIGSEGTMDISRKYFETNPENILSAKLKDSDIRLYNSNENHYKDWLDAIRNKTQPICDVETGHRSATIGNIANIAYQLGRTLEWDPIEEHFKGDAQANSMRSRNNRKYN
ncbi:Gfo/Idh/MocA family protein [Maribacter sp. 2210JD10-5]|uniref:Gfo/Idh/MocA family protein n=1 Tax=Maribacter sp. 2210JD10-5 TaxID=3386272 RepID=UPI0039BC4EB8